MKGKNNDYYLTHSFDKNYNQAGWIFADCKNKFDGTDKNIVIFEHNRKDGSMFDSLKNILTKEWQDNEKNHIIKLYTPESEKEYKVFSIIFYFINYLCYNCLFFILYHDHQILYLQMVYILFQIYR